MARRKASTPTLDKLLRDVYKSRGIGAVDPTPSSSSSYDGSLTAQAAKAAVEGVSGADKSPEDRLAASQADLNEKASAIIGSDAPKGAKGAAAKLATDTGAHQDDSIMGRILDTLAKPVSAVTSVARELNAAATAIMPDELDIRNPDGIGAVLDNPLVKAAIGVSIPGGAGTATTEGIHQYAKARERNGEADKYRKAQADGTLDKSGPSLERLTENFNSNYGFGRLLNDTGGSTGNEWADRGIGLAGDVVLDPLTYLAPQSKISKLGNKGVADLAIKVGEEGDVIQKASRGVSLLSNAELERISTKAMEAGLLDEPLRGGVYFGLGDKQVRLVGRNAATSGVAAKLRVGEEAVRGSQAGQAVGKVMGGVAEKAALTNELRRGAVENAVQAFEALRATQRGRLAQPRVVEQATRAVDNLEAAVGKYVTTEQAAHIAEGADPKLLLPELDPALADEIGATIRTFDNDIRVAANDAARSMGEREIDDVIPWREDHSFNTLTDEARAAFGKNADGPSPTSFDEAAFEKRANIRAGEKWSPTGNEDDAIDIVRANEHPDGLTPRQQAQAHADAVLGESSVKLFTDDYFGSARKAANNYGQRVRSTVVESQLKNRGVAMDKWAQGADDVTREIDGLLADNARAYASAPPEGRAAVMDERLQLMEQRKAHADEVDVVRTIVDDTPPQTAPSGPVRPDLPPPPDSYGFRMDRQSGSPDAMAASAVDNETATSGLMDEMAQAHAAGDVKTQGRLEAELQPRQRATERAEAATALQAEADAGDTVAAATAESLRLDAQAQIAEADLAQAGTKPLAMDAAATKLGSTPNADELVLDVIRQGAMPANWSALSNNTLAPDWMVDILHETSKYATPQDVTGLLKGYDYLTSLFKTWAIATPGFHFRNTFGAFFNNSLAGVESGTYKTWLKANHAYRQGFTAGGHEAGVAAVKAKMGDAVGDAVGEIQRSSLLGVANMADESAAVGSKKLGLTDNPYTRFMQGQTERVENTFRGTLALDTMLKKQGSMDDAIEQVMKYHFDYDDLSQFERSVMKRVVPFYTWSRKNLPLQLESILTKPKVYSRVGMFQRNTEMGTTEDSIVPKWFSESMGIRTPFSTDGGSVYLMPDLPLRDVNNLNSPRQFLSSLNPLIKTPVELTTGKQLFNDRPFQEGAVAMPIAYEAMGLGTALEAIGMASRDKNGQLVTSDQALYTLEQLMPMFGRARRLAPSESRFQDRWATTVASFAFGLGLRTNTADEQRGEIRRRESQLDSIAKDLNSKGYGGYYEWEQPRMMATKDTSYSEIEKERKEMRDALVKKLTNGSPK